MTTDELVAALKSAGVSERAYVVDGFSPGGLPLADGILYVDREGDEWEVGVFERGVGTPIKRFAAEDEACNWAYDYLTRARPKPVALTPEEEEFSRQQTEAAQREARERIAAAKAEYEARRRADGGDGDQRPSA
ncbi:MAG: hypothetical protein ACRDKB_13920 [Actinomycetota bacterium]